MKNSKVEQKLDELQNTLEHWQIVPWQTSNSQMIDAMLDLIDLVKELNE